MYYNCVHVHVCIGTYVMIIASQVSIHRILGQLWPVTVCMYARTHTHTHTHTQVEYMAEGFLEKNKDTLPDMLVDLVKVSSLRLIRALFRRPSSGSQLRKSIMRKR